MVNLLVVGLGGAVGSMLRYGMTLLFAFLNLSGNLATFSVNVIGSFLIGILTGVCTLHHRYTRGVRSRSMARVSVGKYLLILHTALRWQPLI